VLFYVLFVLCHSVYKCTVLLPPGGYPNAVKKYNISYHNTVLKKELLKRILLSGFKLGWSIADIIHSYNTWMPDSITSVPGLVFWMWIWNSAKLPELHIPPPVLCLTVARGCNSEWSLLLCGHILDIRETLQVLLEDFIILDWHFEYTLLKGEIIFKNFFLNFTGYMFVKTCSCPLYLYTYLSYNFILIGQQIN
jgi:hypothetical protein